MESPSGWRRISVWNMALMRRTTLRKHAESEEDEEERDGDSDDLLEEVNADDKTENLKNDEGINEVRQTKICRCLSSRTAVRLRIVNTLKRLSRISDNDKDAKIEINLHQRQSSLAANDNDELLLKMRRPTLFCDLRCDLQVHQNRTETRSITSSTSTIHPCCQGQGEAEFEKRGKKGQARRQIAKGRGQC